MPAEQGVVELPLNKDWPNRPKQMVDHTHGKPAFTAWRVIERGEVEVAGDRTAATRLLLTPRTGRSHQLRVHMAEIGHPILGDPLYGDEASRAAASRLCLHASRLGFTHPQTHGALEFRSSPPF
ncbi:MAG: pseudouridine synthase [Pirellulales bacterium]